MIFQQKLETKFSPCGWYLDLDILVTGPEDDMY